MSKHTPGPWEVNQFALSKQWSVTRRVRDFDDVICRLEPAYDSAENARLIAEAPSLKAVAFAAAENIRGVLSGQVSARSATALLESALKILDEAIAKAEGRDVKRS